MFIKQRSTQQCDPDKFLIANYRRTHTVLNNHGDITFMESRQLESKTGRVLPGVGENLLCAFPEQPQLGYETQRALSGESFSTEIELNGRTFEVHYNPLRNEHGRRQGAIGVATDISDRIEHKKELSRRAHYDELTGLPNRTLIMNQIEHAFDNARRHKKHVAVFFLDLDNFKLVNDRYGHQVGDEVLGVAGELHPDVVAAFNQAYNSGRITAYMKTGEIE